MSDEIASVHGSGPAGGAPVDPVPLPLASAKACGFVLVNRACRFELTALRPGYHGVLSGHMGLEERTV